MTEICSNGILCYLGYILANNLAFRPLAVNSSIYNLFQQIERRSFYTHKCTLITQFLALLLFRCPKLTSNIKSV